MKKKNYDSVACSESIFCHIPPREDKMKKDHDIYIYIYIYMINVFINTSVIVVHFHWEDNLA